MGIWEGSVLAQEAHSLGLETESYTIDAALAPRERDWVSAANVDVAELFFVSESLARASLSWLNAHLAEFYPGWRASDVVVEPGKDWNAEWRASFRGVEVPPDWWVVPPWESSARSTRPGTARFESGRRFGTGTHETTRCVSKFWHRSYARDQGS